MSRKKHLFIGFWRCDYLIDKNKFAELWNPSLQIWFKDGTDDKNMSLLKVATNTAAYWDIEGGKMVNFFKMVSAAITGTEINNPSQGTIKL